MAVPGQCHPVSRIVGCGIQWVSFSTVSVWSAGLFCLAAELSELLARSRTAGNKKSVRVDFNILVISRFRRLRHRCNAQTPYNLLSYQNSGKK